MEMTVSVWRVDAITGDIWPVGLDISQFDALLLS